MRVKVDVQKISLVSLLTFICLLIYRENIYRFL